MDPALHTQILSLLDQHRTMSLATVRPDGWPQATTVGFAHDGLTLYFLCSPNSQKAANIERDERVSLTIDHDVPQMMDITGLSMAARARRVVDRAESQKALQLLMHRYPDPKSLPGPLPDSQALCIFRIVPHVISILDYSKGFGHTELLPC